MMGLRCLQRRFCCYRSIQRHLWSQFDEDLFLFHHDCPLVYRASSIQTCDQFVKTTQVPPHKSPDLNPVERRKTILNIGVSLDLLS